MNKRIASQIFNRSCMLDQCNLTGHRCTDDNDNDDDDDNDDDKIYLLYIPL